LGIDVPKWLIRIDYVFCSYDWQAIDARIGPWDGKSDHRPVIAEVALRTEAYAEP
jgi:endonuclease/exonuclease/phosphatase (EEP) superfamily protein YafD